MDFDFVFDVEGVGCEVVAVFGQHSVREIECVGSTKAGFEVVEDSD